jgi:hypothetical protein
MALYRKTAIVEIVLPSAAATASDDQPLTLPLSVQREFGVVLTIDGHVSSAGRFRSPINDEQWRQFVAQLRDCNVRHVEDNDAYRNATYIRDLGLSLYKTLTALSPLLSEFLDDAGTARRLVLKTSRPELHLLPWGAMNDAGGKLLAAGDLSIVQSWGEFSAESVAITASQLSLFRIAGTDTNAATGRVLKKLAQTFTKPDPTATPDILHVEAHGNAVTNEIDGIGSTSFGHRYAGSKLALLWSCYSGAANSWGESPALSLHRSGSALVLSFQAELHVDDASSIAQFFYNDVFGAAASRDPETALVKVRVDKFTREFYCANWASMTVYLRSPIDLSALPLNGPRVPASGWLLPPAEPDTVPDETPAVIPVPLADPPRDPWQTVIDLVHSLQPGDWQELPAPNVDLTQIPVAAFGGWRGNVIRLDSAAGTDPLTNEILDQLDLLRANPPLHDPAERLVWFFSKIANYGSPLIVWTNAQERSFDFLKTIQPSPALSFLLLKTPERDLSVPELVDQGRLEEARAKCLKLDHTTCGDEVLSAAYYACARGQKKEEALKCLSELESVQEWLLLTGNFISRHNRLDPDDLRRIGARFIAPDDATASSNLIAPSDFAKLHRPEDFYRLAMNRPAGPTTTRRETGRAKHELAYLMQGQGRPGTAELLHRLALADLDASVRHDSRWHFATSAVLRDLADLLSSKPERLDDASKLLGRAMAIQAYHGMRQQLAYSKITAARVALTGGHHTAAIAYAVDAANRMEECINWNGWGEALQVFFDTLAEKRETARMIALANLATEKIQISNLSSEGIEAQQRVFLFEKAKAHWIAGELPEARDNLQQVYNTAPKEGRRTEMDHETHRLLSFLSLTRHSSHAAKKTPAVEEPPL